MALSGSYDFTLTRDTLIQEVLERTGRTRLNKTASSDLIASAAVTLNLVTKGWQMKGLQLFTYRDATLFLQKDTQSYLLGPTGTHATESHVQTTLSASAAAAAGTITVTSATGISASDNIGIQLDSGSLQWTTVNGAPSGSTITLTVALTGAAASGNVVYTYTTKIERPLSVDSFFRRDLSSNDTPIRIESINNYRSLTPKINDGKAVICTYDPQLTNGRLLIWPEPDSVRDRLMFVYKKPVDDFDSSTNNPAYPQDWFEVLVCRLCWKLSPKLRLPLNERLWWEQQYLTAESEVLDAEAVNIQFIPSMH